MGKVLDDGRRAGLFLSREAMIEYLLQMYDEAEQGDVIWAQCVRCTDFTPVVRQKILNAAGKGVRFKMLINHHSPATEEFHTLFDPITDAQVGEAIDNEISFQGFSEKEIVIAVPGIESYTAVLIRNQYFVGIIRTWFDKRFRSVLKPVEGRT